MYLSQTMKNAIRLLLKASNQRIVQLDKDFGMNSPTTQNAVAFLQKGAFNQFRGISSSGHTKIDIPKFIKAIENSTITESEANALLIQATGQKISDGELKTVGTGITTPTREIMKYERDYGEAEPEIRKMSKKELIKEINERNEIAQDFQSEYDDAKSEMTPKEMREAMSFLFQDGKKSYSDLESMTKKIRTARKAYKSKRDALSTSGRDNNKSLKNL